MTNPRGDTFPKGNVVVDENFFVSGVIKIALLGIPEVCSNVIGCVASLYVYYLFHVWPHTTIVGSCSQLFDKDVDQRAQKD